ncbi:MAG: hypothetical protein F4213_03185 [Boseongicola sp. SB0677_bin_26]|nr:hypothetical protein [Boseongicola sp. SB0665_bin_10]MYG25018.1 hypothetical protein [Boseongicola sp. SB0677_bin_26]
MTARIVNVDALPIGFPTHCHSPAFWEQLGRTVATFGFLEEILGKAVFSFTATRRYEQAEVDAAFKEWLPTLQKALTNPLGSLIAQYERAVRDHPEATVEDLDELLHLLRQAAKQRNVLCHGSWSTPDANGASMPLFVDQKQNVFDMRIDCAYLEQVQRHVAEISCAVISSVTHMGWQFPGSEGPGVPITISQ